MTDEKKVYVIAHREKENVAYGQSYLCLPDYYKIGIATDVEQRLSTMQSGTPHELELVTTLECDNARSVESALHSLYYLHNHNGEWYWLSYNDVNSLKALSYLERDTIKAVDTANSKGLFDRHVSLYVKVHRVRNGRVRVSGTTPSQE